MKPHGARRLLATRAATLLALEAAPGASRDVAAAARRCGVLVHHSAVQAVLAELAAGGLATHARASARGPHGAGKPRKVYALTRAGRAAARDVRARLARMLAAG